MNILTLYVIGGEREKIRQLKSLLDEEFKDQYMLEVVDLLITPQLAQEDKVFATPTILKNLPSPIHKVIGDIYKDKKTLVGLNLEKFD